MLAVLHIVDVASGWFVINVLDLGLFEGNPRYATAMGKFNVTQSLLGTVLLLLIFAIVYFIAMKAHRPNT